jgi:hypothetical protein
VLGPQGQRLTGCRAAARALFLSDVPQDDPAVIGSGLLGPAAAGSTTAAQHRGWIDDAVAAVAARARQLGLTVHVAPRRFDDGALRPRRFAHELAYRHAGAFGAGSPPWCCRRIRPRGRSQHLRSPRRDRRPS